MSGWNPVHRVLWTACAALALCALLTACKTPLERAWGVSQHAHVVQSVANPEAGLRSREAPHPDGVSTDSAVTKFRKAETQAEKISTDEDVLNIDSGS